MRSTRHLPVLIVSGVEELDSVVRCIELGATDYLTKPINASVLSARINASLAAKRLHDVEQEALRAPDRAQSHDRAPEGRAQPIPLAAGRCARVLADGEKLLAGHRREITVAFCDLRGFTAFAEQADPEELMTLLGQYHRLIGEAITEHGGTLEHFAGDGVMVFFNDPVPQDDHVERAVRMAVAMRERFAELASAWRQRGYELGFGVGVAVGHATLGRIGFEGRHDYGAIGNVTILASRLSSQAQAGQILLSPRAQTDARGADRVRAGWRAHAEGPLSARAGHQRGRHAVTPLTQVVASATMLGVLECRACGHPNPEASRFCGNCATALQPAAPERRKLATLLFCDVSGSTAMGERLDAEAVRELMHRYFQTMRGVIERHGGTVEKFIGDAVVAIFGVPHAREDDALRAVRAAAEMQARMADLNDQLASTHGHGLRLRIGVNTGEVVAGDASTRQSLVTGDAVNVAARLEQAAGPGEVLLGPVTHRLVALEVDAEPRPALTLKGKTEPMPAFRLIAVRSTPERPARPISEMIGRDVELGDLTTALQRVQRGRPELVTVIGEAGVGKSRLVAEFLAQLPSPHRVLRGRCLSYGEGITYWPIREVARAAAAIRDEDTEQQALEKLETFIEAEDAAIAALRVGQAIGLAGGVAPPDEIAWGVRKLLEATTRDGVTVVVIDDLQWAALALLELLRRLESTIQAPVLLLALARPELLDAQADWRGEILLEPLRAVDIERLVDGLLDATTEAGGRLRQRLVKKAGGNPLFAEELVASLVDSGQLAPGPAGLIANDAPDRIRLPDTLSALLGARIDRLAAAPRQALEGGSVEGEVFHRGAATVMVNAPDLLSALDELTATSWLYPARSDFVEEAAYRFRHLLVRDAAYATIPKRRRAAMHCTLADWLAARSGSRETEFEEIIAYHLEQAFRYLCELGPPDDATRAIGRRAGDLLHAAGRRAILRGDQAARHLLERATELIGDEIRQLEIEVDLSAVPMMIPSEVIERLASVRERAQAVGAELVALHARTEELWQRSWIDPLGAPRRLPEVEAIIGRLRDLDDPGGLSRAVRLQAEETFQAGRGELALTLIAEAIAAAERAGDPVLEEAAVDRRFEYTLWGPTPAKQNVVAAEERLAACHHWAADSASRH